MNQKLKDRFKSEADRCRTLARKNNIQFNEASLITARANIIREPEHYTPIHLILYRDGTVRAEYHR